MIKKMLTILVILSFLGFSAAYAHGAEGDDQATGVAIAAVITFVVTAAILSASHDRHGEYRSAPRHSPNSPYDSRYNGNNRPRDYRYNDNNRTRDYRYNDRNQNYNRYQGEGPGDGNWNKWEGR